MWPDKGHVTDVTRIWGETAISKAETRNNNLHGRCEILYWLFINYTHQNCDREGENVIRDCHVWLFLFRLASSWTPAAVKFVEELLEKSTKFWFVEKKNIKKKSYGDLLVELADETLSLSNELYTKEYAVLSEELFEEGV